MESSRTRVADTALPLARYVESVRAVAPIGGRARRVDRLPNGRTALIFRVLESGRQGDLSVSGPRTRALLKETSGFVSAVMIELKPGWSSPLIGVATSELTNEIVMLDEIWGHSAHELCRELLAATSVKEILDRLALTLARRQRAHEPASAHLARQAVRLLEHEPVRVERVAERLGVTARHLRRAFAENIGITPKDFARSVRLQRAVQRAATSRDWARIAVDAGYYDQSHLIADFRDLVGLTPGAFLKRAANDG